MSWLEDTEAAGSAVEHLDGEPGIVLNILGDRAEVRWRDGSVSTEHEDYLTYPEGN